MPCANRYWTQAGNRCILLDKAIPISSNPTAIGGVADAIFYNQGQCCTAGSRLFAHKSVYDKVVEGMVNKAGKIKVGHGLDPSVQLGPLVSKEQHSKVAGYIESGRKRA